MLTTPGHIDAVLIAYALSVALIDWRTHRIPNVLSAAAAALGLVAQVWIHGEAGLLAALGGAAVGFGAFLPFYLLRAFGAGDVKAMATVGIFLGLQATVLAVAMTLICGGVIAAFVLWFTPAYASAAIHRLIGLIVAPASTLRGAGREAALQPRLRFPYGVAIACGTAATLLATGRFHSWI
jgi:prepilin peptidase CpaA